MSKNFDSQNEEIVKRTAVLTQLFRNFSIEQSQQKKTNKKFLVSLFTYHCPCWDRTSAWRYQKPLPYHLAKGQCFYFAWSEAMGAVGFEPTNPKERSYSPSRLARLRYTPVYLYDYNSISRLVPLCNHFFNFSPFPNHQFRNSQASEKLTIAGLGLMQLTWPIYWHWQIIDNILKKFYNMLKMYFAGRFMAKLIVLTRPQNE